MSVPNPSTALARVVVDELVRHGVSRVFLSPGSRSAALAFAAAGHPAVELAVVVDERSAAFHALGAARATGVPAAVVTTSGTAVANVFPAVVEADTGRVPLIVLTADRPPELRHAGANQTIDQLRIFGAATRWFVEVGVPEDRQGAASYWRSTVSRAVAEAVGRGGPPGPVHLNLAFREPTVPAADDGRDAAAPFTADLGGRDDGGPWTAFSRPPVPAPTREDLGGKVVVWAGSGCSPAVAAERWVVVAEPASGARAPGAVRTGHHLLGHPGFVEAYGPETVVTVGRPGLSRRAALALGRADRHIAVAPDGWPDPTRAAIEMRAALPLPVGIDEDWAAAWREADSLVGEALDGALDALDTPTEPRTARDTARAVPADGVLVAASSMPIRDLDSFMPAAGTTVIANRGASGIDGFVSTALGVAAARPGPVVALAGDLSLLHDANGFLVDRRPDCVFVVVNNDGGGIFSLLPPAAFPGQFERLFLTPHGRSLERLAAFHDLSYRRISRAGELGDAVAAGVAEGGIWLVEVPSDHEENVAVHGRLDAVARAAVDRFLSRGPRASPPA